MSEQVRETPAPRNPFARLLGVITAPRETYQEIARSPRWLPPWLIYLAIFAFAFSVYSLKADWVAIVTDQVENSPFMSFFPEEAKDQAIKGATESFRSLTNAQITIGQLLQIAGGSIFFAHFMALIYATLFVLMGSLADLKLGRAWLNFLLCLLVFVFYIIVYSISQFAFKDAPQSALLLQACAAAITTGVWLWILNGRATRDPEFHRVLCVITYGSAIAIVGAVALLAVTIASPAPIQVGVEKLVPSNLGALVKPDVKALAKLFESLDVFTLWLLAVLSIGFSVVARTSMGVAASITFLPWAVIVLIKLAWAAAFG